MASKQNSRAALKPGCRYAGPARDEINFRSSCSIGQLSVQCRYTGLGDRRIFAGLDTGHADCANDHSIDHDGFAALEGNDRHGQRGVTTVVYHVFEGLARLASDQSVWSFVRMNS